MKVEKKVEDQLDKRIKSQKESFRRHQRELPFGEKMQIAFSLAERDKIIRNSVLLPKAEKSKKVDR